MSKPSTPRKKPDRPHKPGRDVWMPEQRRPKNKLRRPKTGWGK